MRCNRSPRRASGQNQDYVNHCPHQRGQRTHPLLALLSATHESPTWGMWRKRGLPDGGGVRGDDPHSLFDAMDFTLAQLTPENLELIFQGAFYKT